MNASLKVAAIDLGAESGRIVLVKFSDKGITFEEVHRFRNGPVRIHQYLYWDVLSLFKGILEGLSICSRKEERIDCIGLDTWGVDFALLDSQGKLIGLPHHYRDPRTDGMLDEAFALVPMEEIFDHTGIQFMQINTLYQLLSMKSSPQLDIAKTFLMIPDLLNYWLCGVPVCEFTNATTTQMYDQRAKKWTFDILQRLGLPDNIFPEIVPPGTQLGTLLPAVAGEIGMDQIPVIAPACHDTGSAVAAVPAANNRFAYISSGTWSLVGVETGSPTINSTSLAFNFTNEGGVANTVRLLKNVTGMWLVQECRRIWAQTGKAYTYDELAKLAESAMPFTSLIDPDAPDFLHPEDMPSAIQSYCAKMGQEVPQTKASILRCIFDSLALKYRYVFDCLEQLLGYSLEVVHVIGGGSQNDLLNQLTADASGKLIIAGPVEATALGNAAVQAIAMGYFDNIIQARSAISQNIPLVEYHPGVKIGWDEAYIRFKEQFVY
jgi:rhamnulokinase